MGAPSEEPDYLQPRHLSAKWGIKVSCPEVPKGPRVAVIEFGDAYLTSIQINHTPLLNNITKRPEVVPVP